MPSKANVIARVIFDKNLNYKKKKEECCWTGCRRRGTLGLQTKDLIFVIMHLAYASSPAV